jgi:hypothetical protein
VCLGVVPADGVAEIDDDVLGVVPGEFITRGETGELRCGTHERPARRRT